MTNPAPAHRDARKPLTHINIRIDEADLLDLRTAAFARGVTVSALVREWIRTLSASIERDVIAGR